MEYFLPLSVMAMIISSISIYAIDYHNPKTKADSENDQSPSNPPDSMEDSADEYTVSENPENLQNNITTEDNSTDNTIKKIHSTQASLKEIQHPFSMLWSTTPKYTFSISKTK